MRKIIVSEFVSLDGVMEDPGGAETFKHGGWTRAYWGDDIGKFKFDELFASDALLLGRRTYQGFAAAWPSMTDPFADRMNNLPKYVVSTTLTEMTWNNSTLLKGNLTAEIGELKRKPGQDILVFGSGELVHTLRELDLIDEYRLLVYPVVLGSGKSFFRDFNEQHALKLVSTQAFDSGVVALIYQRTSREVR